MYSSKKVLYLILLTVGLSNQWIGINSEVPKKPEATLVTSDIDHSVVSFELSGFSLHSVMIDGSEYFTVKFPVSASIMDEASPDLPKFSSSIIVPDDKSMSLEILSSEFIDYENINVAPSKGNLSRLINPEDVPYVFDGIYKQNSFYPEDIAQLNEPYILRDYRGQVVEFHPIQYNPSTKILRVYTNIEIKVSSDNNFVVNPFIFAETGIAFRGFDV